MLAEYVNEYRKVEDEPLYGDLIVIDFMGVVSHVGINLGNGTMLHTSEKTGCVVEPLTKWKKRIVGYYRPCLE